MPRLLLPCPVAVAQDPIYDDPDLALPTSPGTLVGGVTAVEVDDAGASYGDIVSTASADHGSVSDYQVVYGELAGYEAVPRTAFIRQMWIHWGAAPGPVNVLGDDLVLPLTFVGVIDFIPQPTPTANPNFPVLAAAGGWQSGVTDGLLGPGGFDPRVYYPPASPFDPSGPHDDAPHYPGVPLIVALAPVGTRLVTITPAFGFPYQATLYYAAEARVTYLALEIDYIVGRPPLQQRQRHDGMNGSSGPPIQQRQGAQDNAATRPRLAWRQHTP